MVSQSYESEADNEYVIRGNSAVMKCEVPSFVADFVVVDLWIDSQGNNYYPNNDYGNNIISNLPYMYHTNISLSSQAGINETYIAI